MPPASGPRVEALEAAPDLLAISEAFPDRYSFLLESAARGPLGRHSLLLRCSGQRLIRERDGSLHGPGEGPDFLSRLREWYLDHALAPPAESGRPDLPFLGGWFLYFGYELAGEIEPRLSMPPAPPGMPMALAARCDAAVIIAHDAEPPGEAPAFLLAEHPERLAEMRWELRSVAPAPPGTVGEKPGRPRPLDRSLLAQLEAEEPERFRDSVARIHDYLLAGDVFQVNLSRPWQGRLAEHVSPIDLYRRLRKANPAPFAGLMRHGDSLVLSSSPERLVETRGRHVQTRPIAGTHPRGANPRSDRDLSQRMLAHPKERAEHIMLIDLERNDLGRVCEPGSVVVDELMAVESYAHVHHIVSNVSGTLRHGTTPLDVVRAVFPGGTITGCPKVRCMEIIAELEGEGRGAYTGSMGYLDRYGNMDLNILIRTMQIRARSCTFRTGAGIVADSDPQQELAETVHKARGLLAALGVAIGGEEIPGKEGS